VAYGVISGSYAEQRREWERFWTLPGWSLEPEYSVTIRWFQELAESEWRDFIDLLCSGIGRGDHETAD